MCALAHKTETDSLGESALQLLDRGIGVKYSNKNVAVQ